jgi:hypothetical protein
MYWYGKYLVVSLHQIPEKSVVMDVLVADVPIKVGTLLSRSWDANLKGTLQMDMSYATIPVFTEHRRLYRENRMAYMISNQNVHKSPYLFSGYKFRIYNLL